VTFSPRLFIATSQYRAPVFSENVTAKAARVQLQSLLLAAGVSGLRGDTVPPRRTGCSPTAFGGGNGVSSSAPRGNKFPFYSSTQQS